MKCEVIIDEALQEKVVIYLRKENKIIDEIKNLLSARDTEIFGYFDKQIVSLKPSDICCVAVIGNKVYAVCKDRKLQLKERLYILEEKLPDCFIKINQSCLANMKMIEKFDVSVSGTLKVFFKNGYSDYVSRRQLKNVKERIGI